MSHSISEFLSSAGRFSESELELLKNEAQLINIKKGTILLDKGAICSSVSFIAEGAFIHYNTDDAMHKNIIDLNVENDWVLNPKSFTTQNPSTYSIEAYEDSTLYILSIVSIHRLIAQSQSFLQMGRILEGATSRLSFFDKNYSPDEKYQHLLNNKPKLIQKFPQKLIASYLKISPETLSRVRKRL